LPSRIESPISETCGSSFGSMPRSIAPLIAAPLLSIASVSRKGAAPVSPGAPWSAAMRARQSGIGAPCAPSVAWADTLSSRVRSSVSNPFITDSTVISAATPTATPSSDTQVMKETKKLCSRASE
jgi:hypothetical protein